ncbi:MAG: hypothetical protein NTU84_11180 [Verrucomicrobia bacterium]|nr:hypothetical protein [Verrucomicrobiota bacterium]
MKTQSNLTAAVSVAALLMGSVIFAQDAEPVTPEISICEAAPEIIACEPAPEIAVCPEPFIFPPTTEPPTEEPNPDDIHIDPIVEIPSVIELTEGSEGPVDENEVIDSGDPSEIPSETDLTEGGDGKSDENEVVDSSDPNADNEVTTTVEDDPVDTCSENGVPIEWLKRDGSNGDSPEMYYSMAPNPVAGNSAPVLEKEEAPNVLARGLGQDDKAAAIKTKANAVSPKILSEKNEPTALIKKGRVFLR